MVTNSSIALLGLRLSGIRNTPGLGLLSTKRGLKLGPQQRYGSFTALRPSAANAPTQSCQANQRE